jgi:hypothetical protein
MSVRTAVAVYLGAALMAAWAILRAWDHLTRDRCAESTLPRHADPEIVVQPWDPRTVTLADGCGVFSRN